MTTVANIQVNDTISYSSRHYAGRVQGRVERMTAKAVLMHFTDGLGGLKTVYDFAMWVPKSVLLTTENEGMYTVKTWFANQLQDDDKIKSIRPYWINDSGKKVY